MLSSFSFFFSPLRHFDVRPLEGVQIEYGAKDGTVHVLWCSHMYACVIFPVIPVPDRQTLCRVSYFRAALTILSLKCNKSKTKQQPSLRCKAEYIEQLLFLKRSATFAYCPFRRPKLTDSIGEVENRFLIIFQYKQYKRSNVVSED